MPGSPVEAVESTKSARERVAQAPLMKAAMLERQAGPAQTVEEML